MTFILVVLGAYVRLTHAGLGCPDWPGCYGQLTWPNTAAEVAQANQAYPDRPVEAGKAWREMAHRYLAGGVMLLTLALSLGAISWILQEHTDQILNQMRQVLETGG